MSKESIRGIIFDWGGVLIDNPQKAFTSYCARFIGVTEDNFVQALDKHQPEFRTGLISEEVFWEKMAEELQINITKKAPIWSGAIRMAHSSRAEILALVAHLKEQNYKIGLLSDTEMPAMEFFNEQEYSNLFDATVFSCLEGIVKPNEKIYLLALKRLGLVAQETVFIDDNADYAAAASGIGIHGIQFKSLEQIIKELQSLSVKIS